MKIAVAAIGWSLRAGQCRRALPRHAARLLLPVDDGGGGEEIVRGIRGDERGDELPVNSA